jgi:hypothetical protein
MRRLGYTKGDMLVSGGACLLFILSISGIMSTLFLRTFVDCSPDLAISLAMRLFNGTP